MGKCEKLYTLLKCPIDVPINDLDAWTRYPKHRWIYNRMEICEFQKTRYAPMPVEPKEYPVIIKPIVNLYGMGLNVHKLEDENDFYDHWYSNSFWMEYADGEHQSYDLVVSNGKIVFHTCFIGHKDPKIIGKFDYWETDERCLPAICVDLVENRLIDYTGCLNIEVIGDTIIECHLRMGDVDQIPTLAILQGIIAVYQGLPYDWSDVRVQKTYFFPVWSKKWDPQVGCKFLKEEMPNLLDHNPHILDYEIDDPTMASPTEQEKRLMWLTCEDKNFGYQIREGIYKVINQKID